MTIEFHFREKFEMLRSISLLRNINFVLPQIRLVTSANTLKVQEEIKRERASALLGGGQKRIDAQHKKGLSISILFDFLIRSIFRKIDGS